jgi:membrane protease YdiL (CAAX protease family)
MKPNDTPPPSVEAPPLPHDEPPIEPTPPRRFPLGWVLLVVGVLIMIGGSVGQQVMIYGDAEEQESGGSETELSAVRMQAEMTLDMEALLNLPLTGNGQLAPVLEPLEAQLGEPEAARLYVALSYQAEEEIPEEALQTLEQTGLPEDQNFAQIYSAEELTREEARDLAPEEPETIEGALARIHALRKAGEEVELDEYFGGADAVKAIVGFMGMFGLIIVGIPLAVIFLGLVVTKKIKFVGYPGPGFSLADADRFAFKMSLYIFAFIGLSYLAAGLPLNNQVATILLMVLTFVAVLLALRVSVGNVRDSLQELLGRTRGWGKLVGIGFLFFVGNLPFSMLLILFFSGIMPDAPAPTHPITDQIASGEGLWTIVSLYFLAAVMAPLIEEIAFRGLLFPALQGALKSAFWGILISSVVFGVIHPQGPMLWASLAMVGVSAAISARLTGSLIPALAMHAFHNATVLTFALLIMG